MKDFSNLIERFSRIELGGISAQKIYSPPHRAILTLEQIEYRHPRKAAVNIMLYPKGKQWYFPLIVRTINANDRHSGQISLPGGRFETADKNFKNTAKRETGEEVGVPVQGIKIIKNLTPIYIPPSNFYVYPFVSWVSSTPEFELQKSEARALLQVKIENLFELPDQPKMEILPETHGIAVPVIDYEGHMIWGATSMILSEFRDLLKKV